MSKYGLKFVFLGLLTFFTGCASELKTGVHSNLTPSNPVVEMELASPQPPQDAPTPVPSVSLSSESVPPSPLPTSSSNPLSDQSQFENLLSQGRDAFYNRNYLLAAEYFRQALDIDPENLIAKGNYASSISYQGQLEAGLKIFLELEPIHPDKDLIIDNIANAYAFLGDCDLAGSYKAKINKTLSICPNSLPARNYFNAGKDKFNQGKYEEARLAFLEAIKLLPDFIDARFNLAASLGALGKYQEALNVFLEVEARQPDYPGLTDQLALTYGYLGNCPKATEYNTQLGKDDVPCPLQKGFLIERSTM